MLQSLFGRRTSSRVEQIDAQQLSEMIKSDDAPLIVDVRSPYEYQWDGHIAGSRLLPMQALADRIEELPKDEEIVFVCRSGNRSHVVCEQLKRLGYEKVKNFQGGMVSWKMAGLPTL
ncbi:MAG: rhodanese-like domain-containing protein [Candidatus Promineifilaceae bacterium]|nr:rhodanese-like domain-containing protein [Candidatus Promineifilaceae bacterium]